MAASSDMVARLRVGMWVAAAIAIAYAAVVIGSRHLESRRLAKDAETRKAEEYSNSPLATSALKILQFYSSTPVISAGQPATLCYGVLNARRLSLEPGNVSLSPALSRCVQVSPRQTTKYRLVAADSRGATQEASLEIQVN